MCAFRCHCDNYIRTQTLHSKPSPAGQTWIQSEQKLAMRHLKAWCHDAMPLRKPHLIETNFTFYNVLCFLVCYCCCCFCFFVTASWWHENSDRLNFRNQNSKETTKTTKNNRDDDDNVAVKDYNNWKWCQITTHHHYHHHTTLGVSDHPSTRPTATPLPVPHAVSVAAIATSCSTQKQILINYCMTNCSLLTSSKCKRGGGVCYDMNKKTVSLWTEEKHMVNWEWLCHIRNFVFVQMFVTM